MGMPEGTGVRIEILGPVRVLAPGRPPREISGVPGSVLARLALARGRPVPEHHFFELLRSDVQEHDKKEKKKRVSDHVADVRAALAECGIAMPRQRRGGQSYELPVAGHSVDAEEFREQVEALRSAEPVDPVLLTRLFDMWRENPAGCFDVDTYLWKPVRQARDDLIAFVREHLSRGAPEPEGWPEYVAKFDDLPAEPIPASVPTTAPAVAPVPATVPVPRNAHPPPCGEPAVPLPPGSGELPPLRDRPRILLVEDSVGDFYVRRLERRFDTVLVKDQRKWKVLLESGDLDFDAAVVDRHLTEANNDDDGFDVLQDLMRTNIPRALVTAYIADEIIEDLKAKYKIDVVYVKDPSGDRQPNIREIVAALLAPRRPSS
jgi:hypothetical protein